MFGPNHFLGRDMMIHNSLNPMRPTGFGVTTGGEIFDVHRPMQPTHKLVDLNSGTVFDMTRPSNPIPIGRINIF